MSAIGAISGMYVPSDDAVKNNLRETVNQVMGSVFYGPLLASARNTALKSEVGHGGRGEDVFKAQLDQILAERAGGAAHEDVGDVLYRRFEAAALRTANMGI